MSTFDLVRPEGVISAGSARMKPVGKLVAVTCDRIVVDLMVSAVAAFIYDGLSCASDCVGSLF